MAEVGLAGSIAAPETAAPEGLATAGVTLAAFSMALGTSAEIVSAVSKEIDAHVYGGSKKLANQQVQKAAVDLVLDIFFKGVVPESMQSKVQSAAISTFKESTEQKGTQLIDKQINNQ